MQSNGVHGLGFVLAVLLVPLIDREAAAQFTLEPGDVIVADQGWEFGNKTVVLRKADGRVLLPSPTFQLGPPGRGNNPSDVAVDSRGRIVVVVFNDPVGIVAYRLETDGSFAALPGQPQNNDAFGVTVDKFDNVLIANGVFGLHRISEGGVGTLVSTGHASGVTIGSNGNYFTTRAMTNEILEIRPDGQESVFFGGAVLLAPLGLTRDHSDRLFVANAGRKDILSISADGRLSVISRDAAFDYPSDVGLTAGGELIVPDGADGFGGSETVYRVATNGKATRLISDLDDGRTDGLPVDDPFGVAVVPPLFLTWEGQPSRGGQVVLSIRGEPGIQWVFGISTGADPTPLSRYLPVDDRLLDIDIRQLKLFCTGSIGSGGLTQVSIPVPPGLPIRRYFVQAISLDPTTNRIRDISNAISAGVF